MTLTDSEVKYIEGILGREMNELEEGMLDVMFSEHCSYKSSRPILKLFPTEGENIVLGPGDDAGLVSITDEYALAVGMESHNHPSAIEPYGGAGTGIGGILRDIISTYHGDHVELGEGTGFVHTAPGHGPEDFEIGQKIGLPIHCPVDEAGCFTEDGGMNISNSF